MATTSSIESGIKPCISDLGTSKFSAAQGTSAISFVLIVEVGALPIHIEGGYPAPVLVTNDWKFLDETYTLYQPFG
ncbi:hypothetical protein [Bacillus sp. SA1-12]|uniref:hypothetical protein n=1 Tax=Bacillus sp. SA1-12 TaxID=1455638 RepID=UPI000B14F95B|nr:hypothetical protein [Bacillus sp. SA1-12]